jgi:hypothetical protein
MATRAQKGQRRRRKKEKKDQNNFTGKAQVHLKKKASKKKTKKQKAISISSEDSTEHNVRIEILSANDSNEEELNQRKGTDSVNQFEVIEIEIDGEESEHDEISPAQELELEENNQANDMINFLRATIDDGDTSGEDEMSEDEPLQALWSIFEKSSTPALTTSPARRKLKSGKFGYQKPVKNVTSLSKKLAPAVVPKQTRHDRKNKRIEAIGKDNNMMSNWLVKKSEDNEIPQPSEDQAATNVNPVTSTIPNPDYNYETIVVRLENQMDSYLSAPKSSNVQDVTRFNAEANWHELQKAIQSIIADYKRKAAKDKSVQYPEAVIANLNEFNYLQREYRLNGTPKASLAASLVTAQSSIRRRQSSTNIPPDMLSGIYYARKIARQAEFVVLNKALPPTMGGNRRNHASLIDNTDIRKSIFTWAASQIPGEVSSLHIF